MKTQSVRYVLAVGLAALPGLVQAQPSAHYVPGVEGIKGSSLPPPGWYVKDYNYFYKAGQVNDTSGDEIAAAGFDSFVYANIPRVIWITDTKLLGGFVGVDALLPIVSQQAQVNAPWSDKSFGIGDFFAEGTLSWHPKQFDLAIGTGFFAPTGNSASPPTTAIGNGYWTFMQTAAATWYIDAGKTWAVSALSRYEFNLESRETHITPGQAYTLEWGISKTLGKVNDLGVVGYYQAQVTTDSGNGASGVRDRAAAVGPEYSVVFPDHMLFVSIRYLYEFMAVSRAQGHAVTVTITKRF
jgi:hypothetical protein